MGFLNSLLLTIIRALHTIINNYALTIIVFTILIKVAVLPLSKKLSEGAEKVFTQLSKKYNCEFDERGNIGKRYRRQDEIGTPLCITYDFESEEDGCVTVRDRDTMQQIRLPISELKDYIAKKIYW